MTAEIFTEQRKTKFFFFSAYAISVALIIFLVSWIGSNSNVAQAKERSGSYSETDNEKLETADQLLHAKMDALNKLYSDASWQTNQSAENGANLQATETAFGTTLDSLEKKALQIPIQQQKEKWVQMITSFKNNFYGRSALFAAYTQRKSSNDDQSSVNKENDKIIALQKIIAERDKTIDALQLQDKQEQPVGKTLPNEEEWKRKYAQIKTVNDKLNTENNNLKNAYNTVAEDNRRLLVKIQSAKKQ